MVCWSIDSGPLTSVVTQDRFTESWDYNASGLLSLHTDKAGVKDQPTYDGDWRGLVVSDTEGLGTGLARTMLYTFDYAGRENGERDFMGRWTTFTLDSMGDPILTTNAVE